MRASGLMRTAVSTVATVTLGASLVATAARADMPTLVLQNHMFQPSTVTVPAGKMFVLRVENHDTTPEEFESSAFHVEKVVVGGGHILVHVAPLAPGSYSFWGDYHPHVARGTVVATPGAQ